MPKPKPRRASWQSFTAGHLGKCQGGLALVVSNAVALRQRGYSAYIKPDGDGFPQPVFELRSDLTVVAVQVPWHLAPENIEAHIEEITKLIHLREECA